MGSEVVLDTYGTPMAVINVSNASIPDIHQGLVDKGEAKIADAIGRWIQQVSAPAIRRQSRFGGILDRDKYLSPISYYDKVRVARDALKDDVVGGAADITEAHAIDKIGIESDNKWEEDVWNQVAEDLDLEGVLRKHWRALYTDSAAVPALWWSVKTYTPRIPAKGGKMPSRKQFDIRVPIGITYFDVTKIVPVGNLMFGQELVAYAAEPLEAFMFDAILAARDGREIPQNALPPMVPTTRVRNGSVSVSLDPRALTPVELNDPMVERMVLSRYTPSLFEQQQLLEDGVEDVSNLFLLNPTAIFRDTLTRLDYDRFPDVRLESVFPLLDLKAQLRQMDRVHLVGGAHMIVLITKGSDKVPAEPEEIARLQQNATTIAQVPLIVGDHRLDVKIITPSLDITLNREKWDTLDVRLFARAFGSFIPTGEDLGDPTKIGQVIGKNLGARRKAMRRFWEKTLLKAIRDANPEEFTERAKLVFQPANIAFNFDADFASFILDLRQGGDIARGTALAQFGMSVADEARKVQREQEAYGDLFQRNAPFNPFGSQSGGGDDGGGDPQDPNDGGDGGGDGGAAVPDRVATRSGGRQAGGRSNGGGSAPGTRQGKEPVGRSRSGGGRRARKDG